jgi:hypothetical protein
MPRAAAEDPIANRTRREVGSCVDLALGVHFSLEVLDPEC